MNLDELANDYNVDPVALDRKIQDAIAGVEIEPFNARELVVLKHALDLAREV